MARKYDSTVARMAGNILSGQSLPLMTDEELKLVAEQAVRIARALVAETLRTEVPEEAK